jgi:hypothetical protein
MAKTHFPLSPGYKSAEFLSCYFEGNTTGNVFFVNSANGTDTAGYGFSPELPFATINFAVTQCAANNGDVVYVMPGHTETITAAGGCTLGVAGVAIRGMGTRGSRGNVNFTTSSAGTFLVSAAGCSVDNLTFSLTGVAALAKAISVTAADFTITNSRFTINNSTNQAVYAILTTAAGTRMTVNGCEFFGTADAGVTAAIGLVGGDSHRIMNSQFIGGYSAAVGAIQNLTTACTNAEIFGNTINNLTALSTNAMAFAAGATGQIAENSMQILSGTAPITGTGMSWVGPNYYADAIATGSTLV